MVCNRSLLNRLGDVALCSFASHECSVLALRCTVRTVPRPRSSKWRLFPSRLTRDRPSSLRGIAGSSNREPPAFHDRGSTERSSTMAITYGVLRGTFDRAKREDNDPASPHLQIRVLANGTPWRISVNVHSQDGSKVVYWVVNPLTNHPILNAS